MLTIPSVRKPLEKSKFKNLKLTRTSNFRGTKIEIS